MSEWKQEGNCKVTFSPSKTSEQEDEDVENTEENEPENKKGKKEKKKGVFSILSQFTKKNEAPNPHDKLDKNKDKQQPLNKTESRSDIKLEINHHSSTEKTSPNSLPVNTPRRRSRSEVVEKLVHAAPRIELFPSEAPVELTSPRKRFSGLSPRSKEPTFSSISIPSLESMKANSQASSSAPFLSNIDNSLRNSSNNKNIIISASDPKQNQIPSITITSPNNNSNSNNNNNNNNNNNENDNKNNQQDDQKNELKANEQKEENKTSTVDKTISPSLNSNNTKSTIKLSPSSKTNETKRREILDELIQTEIQYIENLEIILNIFLVPLRQSEILDRYQIIGIFSNVEAIYPVNLGLINDLKTLQNSLNSNQSSDSALNLGRIFANKANLFKLYAVYCSNQPNIHDRLVELQGSNEEFVLFLKKCFRKQECRKLDIEAFLISPLQRLCKYPLLLRVLFFFYYYKLFIFLYLLKINFYFIFIFIIYFSNGNK